MVMTSSLPGQPQSVRETQQHRQHGGLRHVAQGQGHLRPAQVSSGVQRLGISARGEFNNCWAGLVCCVKRQNSEARVELVKFY